MQFNIVALSVAALVATAAAQNSTTGNGTNVTNPSPPPKTPEGNSAFNNAVSGGLLGAVVAAGLVLVL